MYKDLLLLRAGPTAPVWARDTEEVKKCLMLGSGELNPKYKKLYGEVSNPIKVLQTTEFDRITTVNVNLISHKITNIHLVEAGPHLEIRGDVEGVGPFAEVFEALAKRTVPKFTLRALSKDNKLIGVITFDLDDGE